MTDRAVIAGLLLATVRAEHSTKKDVVVLLEDFNNEL